MALSDITRDSVLQAIREFDDLERGPFLARYKFGKSRGYFLLHRGKQYDSKAIAGAAHGYIGAEFHALAGSQFTGGDKTVAKLLRKLDFTIQTSSYDTEGVPFEIGKLYHRQRDIHQLFGGQERGGIATPNGAPFVFLFTGESGEQFGYSDGWRDGVFAYTGEGQRGDMAFVRGNRAIRDHMANGKDLLLFEATNTKGRYRFRGCFAFASWNTISLPDLDGNPRAAIIFDLVPVNEVETSAEGNDKSLEGKSLFDLRALAMAAAAIPKEPAKEAQRAYYVRSAKVKAYVLKRANGFCEACKNEAPFQRKDGTPYLEPHHIKRVADGGPDHPAFVGAICPTCHRLIHHGKGGRKLNAELEQYVLQREKSIDSSGID